MKIAVVGAGIAGRLTALRLVQDGHAVALYDEHGPGERKICSYAAAGLLAPVTEAAHAETLIGAWGRRSVAMWPELLREVRATVTFRMDGTLALARAGDEAALVELATLVERRSPGARTRKATGDAVGELEPGLAGLGYTALLIEGEGRIDNHELLEALATELPRRGVDWRHDTRVARVEPHRVDGRTYDWVFDCRGLAARGDLTSLRGVRGETAIVRAPEVLLSRPIHVLHQRYPIYVVPRGEGTFVVGATQIESDSRAPVSIKGAMELLGACYEAHPGFRYASVEALVADARPAFFDHRPRVLTRPGLTRVNGLFRHGYLLAPLVTAAAVASMNGATPDPDLAPLFEEVP